VTSTYDGGTYYGEGSSGGVSPAVARVLRGYSQLSSEEQDEFITSINSYNRADYSTKTAFRRRYDEILRVDVGPVSGVCGCCGR
jgi:hypothetical protein